MASGNDLVVFRPQDDEMPATAYAQLDVRNGHPVLAFDGTTAEKAIFSGLMPRHYGGGGITIYLTWCAVPTSGNVGWLLALERIGAAQQDVDSDGFASDQTVTAATVDGTSGNTSITNAAITNGANMDSVAAGELFRLRVTRDVNNDTAAGDAQLMLVEIKET